MVPTEADHEAVHIRRPYPNENAFPYVVTGLDEFTAHPGLTKREFFAALCLQGLIAETKSPSEYRGVSGHVEVAVIYADALIEALQPPQS